MTKRVKVRIMVTVTLLMSIGFLMMRQTNVGRIVLGCVWVFHLLYFSELFDIAHATLKSIIKLIP